MLKATKRLELFEDELRVWEKARALGQAQVPTIGIKALIISLLRAWCKGQKKKGGGRAR